MFPTKTANSGISLCFPDVCKVPAPPAPFAPAPYPNPNLGNATNEDAAKKTKLATKAATTSGSMGTLAGRVKGIASNTSPGSVVQMAALSQVKLQGSEAANIRGKMSLAHQKLMAFNGTESPQLWQAALEDYVLAATATYLKLNA